MDVCGGGKDMLEWTPGTSRLRQARAGAGAPGRQARRIRQGRKRRSAGAAAYPEVNGLFEEIEVALGVDADGALAGARLHHMVRVEQLAVDEARAIVFHGLRSAAEKRLGNVPKGSSPARW